MLDEHAGLTAFLAGLWVPLSLMSDCFLPSMGEFEFIFFQNLIIVIILQGSGAAGSWWALRELTGGRCSLKSNAELGHAALKFLLANTSAKKHLGLGPKMDF